MSRKRRTPLALINCEVQLGDPVKFKEAPYLGRVTNVGHCYYSVRPVGRKYDARLLAPEELEVCRCARSQFLTPLGQVSEEKQHARC